VRWWSAPEDFRVDEVPLHPPLGEGRHTWVLVEKRLLTTEEVARALARAAGVPAREVGFAGRKDRVAVATQWLSVPGLDPSRALEIEHPGLRVLEAARHPHKLRTGRLRANRFQVALRGVDAAVLAEAQARLERICRSGMPNRFGPQRFGRDGENARRARRILSGEMAGTERRQARFLLSALQAEVFNEVLAARTAPLDRVERGDVAFIHASGGRFLVEDLEREAPRAAAFEISATGPIFGSRALSPTGPVAERERRVLADRGVVLEDLRPPRGIRLRGSRRPLRVRPEEADLETTADGARLRFALPSGSFATVLLEELLAGFSGPDDIAPGGGMLSR
jgi:tRNA pseudouridine13 synthase